MNKEDMIELLKSEPLLQAYIGAFTLMFSQGIVTYMLPVKVEAPAIILNLFPTWKKKQAEKQKFFLKIRNHKFIKLKMFQYQ
ncbi:hypothetical protein bcgnr5377_65510 [Bacillus cereus]